MSDDLSAFCRERYDHEAGRRSELTNAISIPLGVLIVLGSLLAAILTDVGNPSTATEWILVLLCAASLIALVFSGVFLARSLFGFTYRYISTPLEMRTHYFDLIARIHQSGLDLTAAKYHADRLLAESLQTKYAECAHHNTINNDRKSAFIHRANGSLLIGLAVALVAGLTYLFLRAQTPPPIPRVQIVNSADVPVRIGVEYDRTARQHGAEPAASAASPAGSAATPGATRSLHQRK